MHVALCVQYSVLRHGVYLGIRVRSDPPVVVLVARYGGRPGSRYTEDGAAPGTSTLSRIVVNGSVLAAHRPVHDHVPEPTAPHAMRCTAR
eukprot:4121966-Prymnesium_polylepis.1